MKNAWKTYLNFICAHKKRYRNIEPQKSGIALIFPVDFQQYYNSNNFVYCFMTGKTGLC